MGLGLGDKSDAEKWLTEEGWIVFEYGGDGFERYLEDKYFSPGTPKNAEFEILIAQFNTHHGPRIRFLFRIKNTKRNRRVLKKALEEFYQCKLSWQDFEQRLAAIKRGIRELVKFLR